MSIGRVEMVNEKKQYVPYSGSSGGVGNVDTKSKLVYIEKYVKTEALLNDYPLKNKDYVNVITKKYDALTGELLDRNTYTMEVRYIPLSFNVIPLNDILGTLYPNAKGIINTGFFAYLGIGVELSSGEFTFRNLKGLSENPFFTWYKTYSGSADLTINGLKNSYPAMLFRGFLMELKTDNPMYIKGGTKKLENADAYI